MTKALDKKILEARYGVGALANLEALQVICEGLDCAGEELAILTQYLESRVKYPDISDSFYEDVNADVEYNKNFEFIDLFAGIGGFRLALNGLGGQCVFSSEWEKNAKSTYFNNHNVYPFGDINKFSGDNLSDNRLGSLVPSHDILAAGFPCQPFSLAGVSARNSVGKPHGFECDTQGTLFRSIERIAKVKTPKLLLLENVRNIISHDGGRTFDVIKNAIESVGYKFFHKIINAETMVPQKRVRCFMVCVRKDIHALSGDFVFPEFLGHPLALSSILRKKVDPRYTISEALWAGHQKRSQRNKARGTGFTTGLADLSKPSNTIVARYGKDGKECLIPQEGTTPRMLSIEECRDLFGYPADFKLPTAKTVTFKLLGNSVVVPVVRLIAAKMVKQYLNLPKSSD